VCVGKDGQPARIPDHLRAVLPRMDH